MAKNLSFFSKVFTDSLSAKVFRLLLFILPLLSFTNGNGQITKGKDSLKTGNSVEISVSKGTLIIGMDNIYHAKIVEIKDTVKKIPKKLAKQSLSKEIILALSEKKAKIKTAEKLEEQEIKKNVDFVYNGNQKGDSNYSQKSRYFFNAVFSPFNVLQKTIGASANAYQIEEAVKLSVKKQKLFTSLSYLQFGKYRSSSLRAPPQYS